MINCMIVGDSIAVGTAMHRPECVSYAKVGWNSQSWNRDYLHKVSSQPVKTVIISLGANDHMQIRSEHELRKLRSSLNTARVFWISPGAERRPRAQAAIEKIAAEYGDTIVNRPKQHMSGDGVHPTGTGYKILGEQTK